MCGFSPAPAPPGGGLLREWAAFLAPHLDWGWTSFGSWLDRLRQAGITANVVPFVGHGTLRIAAMGFAQRPPTADEARRMAARGVPAEQALLDLLLETEGQVSMIHFLMLDANVARGLQFPHVTIGSDNLGLCAGPEEAHAGKPHPRQHGCFPKVLGTYVRERGVLSWEAAVHRMTGQSAARLGLADRGVLRPGAFADVVVFDPETVDDLATYQAPHRYPAGIRGVWVNGRAVLEAGRFYPRPAATDRPRPTGRDRPAATDRPHPRAAALGHRQSGPDSGLGVPVFERSLYDLI